MNRAMSRIPLIAALICLVLLGCGGVFARVQRAEVLYQEHRYQDARTVLSDVRADAHTLSTEEQTLYHYLLGMLAERGGDNQSALYHLSVARELAGERGAGLSANQRATLTQTLASLEENRFGTAQ